MAQHSEGAINFPIYPIPSIYLIKGTEGKFKRALQYKGLEYPDYLDTENIVSIVLSSDFVLQQLERNQILNLNMPFVLVNTIAGGSVITVDWNTHEVDHCAGPNDPKMYWRLASARFDVHGEDLFSNPIHYYFTAADVKAAKIIHLKEVVLG